MFCLIPANGTAWSELFPATQKDHPWRWRASQYLTISFMEGKGALICTAGRLGLHDHPKADFKLAMCPQLASKKKGVSILEKEVTVGRSKQREKGRESQADSMLSTESNMGLELKTLRS